MAVKENQGRLYQKDLFEGRRIRALTECPMTTSHSGMLCVPLAPSPDVMPLQCHGVAQGDVPTRFTLQHNDFPTLKVGIQGKRLQACLR